MDQPYPPPQPHYGPKTYRPPAPKPWLVPMIFLTVAIVLLGIAMATAWWHVEIKNESETPYSNSEMSIKMDFMRDEINGEGDYSGDGAEYVKGKDAEIGYDEANLDKMEGTFGNTNTFTIITMILAFLTLVFVIICGLRFIPFSIALVLCLVTLLISIIAPIYFAIANHHLGSHLDKDHNQDMIIAHPRIK